MNVEEYKLKKKENLTSFLKNFVVDKYVNSELNSWRKKYSLEKLIE